VPVVFPVTSAAQETITSGKKPSSPSYAFITQRGKQTLKAEHYVIFIYIFLYAIPPVIKLSLPVRC
jgi:hypothetical protein